jgi:Helix-turn-helix domain
VSERYAKVPVSILDAGLTIEEIFTYIAIRSFANTEGRAWPAHDTLAEMLQVTRWRVRRAVDSLVANPRVGLKREPFIRAKGGYGPNTYRFTDGGGQARSTANATPTDGGAEHEKPPTVGGGQARSTANAMAVSEHENRHEQTSSNRPGNKPAPLRDAGDLQEVLSKSCYPKGGKLTPIEHGKLKEAAKQLAAADATPEDIEGRAEAYRRKFRDRLLTPMALAGNWNALEPWEDPEPLPPIFGEETAVDEMAQAKEDVNERA